MSKVEEFSQVYWMDIRNGRIAASDVSGKVALINSEGETIWVKKNVGGVSSGWMCLMDDTGVYHGHSGGVHKRQLADGAEVWKTNDIPYILFGQQDDKFVYPGGGYGLVKLDKTNGKVVTRYGSGSGPSCAVTKDSNLIISADPFCVYQNDGKMLYDFSAYSKDTPVSMATWGNFDVFGVRTKVTKYDFSPEAMKQMRSGYWKTQSFTAQSIAEITPQETVAVTTDTSGGILCECVNENGKLRVRVIAPGYNKAWNIQFPRAIREDGAKYVVEKIVDQGGFYRAWGDIKKVQN